MLQSEEQAMTENSENFSHFLAMFAFNNKASGHPQSQFHTQGGSNRGRNDSKRGRGGGRYNNNGQLYSSQSHQTYPSQGYSSQNSPSSQFGGQNL